MYFFRCRSHSFNVHTPKRETKTQDPPIEHDLYATLEEINKGCVKKMKISRRILQADGTPKKEDKLVNIAIKPGWKSGTRVTFQKEGDQTHGKIPADIVFVIRDKPHPLYKREGSDVRYTARLTLKQVNIQIIVLFFGFLFLFCDHICQNTQSLSQNIFAQKCRWKFMYLVLIFDAIIFSQSNHYVDLVATKYDRPLDHLSWFCVAVFGINRKKWF